MPRKTPIPPLPPLPVPIHPTAVYDMAQARAALGVAASTLAREVRLGRIRHAQRGGKRVFLGSWLVEWITGGEVRASVTVAVVSVKGDGANGSGQTLFSEGNEDDV